MPYFAPNLRRTNGPRHGRRRFAIDIAAPGESDRLGIQKLALCFALCFALCLTRVVALGLRARAGFGGSGLGMMGLGYAPG